MQRKRRANEPLQTERQYDEEQDDEGHVLLVDDRSMRGTGGPGSPARRPGAGAAAGGGTGGAGGRGPQRPGGLGPEASSTTPWGITTGSGAHGPDPLALGAVQVRGPRHEHAIGHPCCLPFNTMGSC